MTDEVSITIIATGFDRSQPKQINKPEAFVWDTISVSPPLRDQSKNNEYIMQEAPEEILQSKTETIDFVTEAPQQECASIKRQECESIKKNIMIDPHDLDVPAFKRRMRE